MSAGFPWSLESVSPLTAWLLTYLVHSTALLALTYPVTRFLVGSHQWRDLLWKTALFGGLVTSVVQRAIPMAPLAGELRLPPAAAPAADPATPAGGSRPAEDASAADPDPATASLAPGRGGSLPLAGKASEPEAGAADRANARHAPVAELAALIWLVAAAGLVLLLVWQRIGLSIRLGERRQLTGTPLNTSLDELRRATGVRRQVRLTTTASLSSPLALGLAEICIPEAALTELDQEQQRAMLAHELAHLARLDPLWLAAISVVERIFFIQPLNRLARHRMQEAAEYLCDDWAVRRTGSSLGLAKCLVTVAEWLDAAPATTPVAGMAENRSHLVARVRRLIEEHAMTKEKKSRWLLPAAAGIIGITAIALPAVTTVGPRGEGQRGLRAVLSGGRLEDTLASRDGQAQAADSTGAVVTALIAALKDPDVEVRRAVVRALGNRRDLRAVPGLTEALRDQDAEVRSGAIEALAELGDTRAASAFASALGDESVEVRRAAARGLAELKVPDATDPLIRALKDGDAEVRQTAAEALGEIGDRRAVPGLIEALADRSADVRHQAAHALGHLKDPRAVEGLTALLKDPNADVRSAALDALNEMDLETLPTGFLDALRDASSDVRSAAAHALGEHRDARAVPALRLLIEDSSPDVREAAIGALAEIRTSEAIDAIVAALKSKDPNVRKAAAEALGQR
jgi:HEAT repeat protein/beta-lactamase regulating signal transducer with metallopeptidase domain